jgi:FtsP/CotA-like multicopper oxidase with cupredoxin domain
MTRLRGFALPALLSALALAAIVLATVALARSGDGDDRTAGGANPPVMAQEDDLSETGEVLPGGHGEHGAAASAEGVPDATEATGGAPLEPLVDGETWSYELTTKAVRWEILPGLRVTAYTYNGTVPGPELRVPYGQRVRIVVRNELPDPTTVHWHGIAVPNVMDGVPGVTQEPIEPGESFTYEFDAIPAGRDSDGGTFFYHSHFQEDRQVGLGLAGVFVIESPDAPSYDVEQTILIGEWSHDPETGETRPPMELEGSLPNFFTLNGKSYPATEPLRVRLGDEVLLRVVGGGQFEHPMHLHGTDFRIVAKDGHPIEGPSLRADTVQIAPGERFDLVFTATEPGTWLFHCHIGHHLTNNGEDPGGLILPIEVSA